MKLDAFVAGSVQGDAAGLSPTTTLEPEVQGILGRVLDHNKYVQESACSALATLEETAGNEECTALIEPYLLVRAQCYGVGDLG